MMLIRMLTPEDRRQYAQMRALTYHAALPEEIDDATAYPPRAESAGAFRYAAFDAADSTMLGGLTVIPYPVRFDGNVTTLMGVGEVATLPPYRRMGVVRGCMEKALPHMYDAGAVFSYLFPFSTVFYRKFGYERCAAAFHYRLHIEHLPERHTGGFCKLMQTGDDFSSDVRRIYSNATARYNFAVVPEEYELAWVRQYAPLSTCETAYVYYTADSTPKAFLLLSRKRDTQGFLNIVASRVMFSDAEGFFGLCALVRSFRSDCRRWCFTLPAALDLMPLLPETSLWTVECTVGQNGMVRVVNVMEALRLARYAGSGEVTLAITDAQIPQNCGTFRVCFSNGCAALVEKSDTAPDAAMDISVFSRLLAGACTPDALPNGDITYISPAEKLRPVFYFKPCFMTEDF